MKKTIAVILCAVSLLAVLTGCGKKTECDFCGETKSCKTTTFFGEKISYCRDCESEIRNGY